MSYSQSISLKILFLLSFSFLNACQGDKSENEEPLISIPINKQSIINHDYDNLIYTYLKTEKSCKNFKQKVLKFQPDFDNASQLYLEAYCYFETDEKEAEDVIKIIKEAYQLAPNDKNGVALYAVYSGDLEDDKDSINVFKQALKLSPKNYNLYYDIAQAYANMNEVDKQIKVLKEAIRAVKKDDTKHQLYKFYYTLGEVYQDNNEPKKALKNYKLAINSTDEDIDEHLYNLMGMTYDELENYDDAVDMYKKAVSIDEEYACGYSNMGFTLNKMGKHKEAKRVMNESLSINPKDSCSGMLYYNLGITFRDIDNCTEALKNYYLAIDNDIFTNSQGIKDGINYNIGRCHTIQDEFDKGISFLVKDKSLNSDSYYYMGKAYFGKKEYDKAIENLNKSIEEWETARAYELLGNLYFIKRDFNQARQFYKKAIKEDSELSLAYAKLGILSVKDEDLEKAIGYYLKAIKNDPDNTEYQRQLFLVYLKDNHCEKAKKLIPSLASHADSSTLKSKLSRCQKN